MNKNDEKEKVIADWLNTSKATVIMLLYFRIKLYQGKFTVSFDDMMYVLNLPELKKNTTGVVCYQAGVTKYKKIDVWLQQKFNSYRDNLLQFRGNERLVLADYQKTSTDRVIVRIMPPGK